MQSGACSKINEHPSRIFFKRMMKLNEMSKLLKILIKSAAMLQVLEALNGKKLSGL